MRIWTFTEAAKELGLQTSSGVTRRIQALERRGEGLTIAAGEFVMYGGRRVLTDKGVERLRGASYPYHYRRTKDGIKQRIKSRVRLSKEEREAIFNRDVYIPESRTDGHITTRQYRKATDEELESIEGVKGWDI